MLDQVYWGNSVLQYLQAAGVFAAVVVVALFAQSLIVGRLKALAARTSTDFDDFAVDVLGAVRAPEFYLLAFYIAARPLHLPSWLDKGFRHLVVAAVTYRILRIVQRIVDYGVGKALRPGPLGPTEADKHTRRNITYLVNVVLWITALLFVLANLGFNVTSMIAGLGVGGIAIALAAQAVLGDLFSAVAIFLDKPFLVGDAISFDGFTGVVERIGLKTTRIRLLSGEILVAPNSALTSAKIKNFRDFADRRVVFTFGVVYGTPAAKLKAVPEAVKAIIQGQKRTRFDRAHLTNLGASSLDFEVVYYVEGSDYALYMDTHQAVLLALADLLEKEGVEFAFPTRTVHLADARSAKA